MNLRFRRPYTNSSREWVIPFTNLVITTIGTVNEESAAMFEVGYKAGFEDGVVEGSICNGKIQGGT